MTYSQTLTPTVAHIIIIIRSEIDLLSRFWKKEEKDKTSKTGVFRSRYLALHFSLSVQNTCVQIFILNFSCLSKSNGLSWVYLGKIGVKGCQGRQTGKGKFSFSFSLSFSVCLGFSFLLSFLLASLPESRAAYYARPDCRFSSFFILRKDIFMYSTIIVLCFLFIFYCACGFPTSISRCVVLGCLFPAKHGRVFGLTAFCNQ